MAAKLKATFAQYGKVAVLFHSSVWMSTLTSTLVGLRAGVDLQAAMSAVPFVEDAVRQLSAATGVGEAGGEAGALLTTAYLITTATGPLRGVLTVTATPAIAASLDRRKKN